MQEKPPSGTSGSNDVLNPKASEHTGRRTRTIIMMIMITKKMKRKIINSTQRCVNF